MLQALKESKCRHSIKTLPKDLRAVQISSDTPEYLIIRHLSSPMPARLMEMYYNTTEGVPTTQ